MDTLYIKITSPSQTLFEGPALSLSSTNSEGPFDILPQHANFLTMTRDAPIIITTPDNKRIQFKLALSIVYNVGNNVSVYTDIMPA